MTYGGERQRRVWQKTASREARGRWRAAPSSRTIARLLSLIGGLNGPGYRVRLWASLGADAARQGAVGVFAVGAGGRHQ